MIEINISNNYSSTIELNNELINQGSLRANEFFITAEFAKTYEELTRYVCTFNFRRNDNVEINGLVATPVMRNSKWGWYYIISSKDITALDGDLHLTIKLNNLNEDEVITTTSFTLHVEHNAIGEEQVLINDAQYNALLDKFNKYYISTKVDELLSYKVDKSTYSDSMNMIKYAIMNTAYYSAPNKDYASLSALQTAFPNGASGVYITSDNGHWYYWNGSVWTDGGVYQSSEDVKQIKEDLSDLNNRIGFTLPDITWENKTLHTTGVGQIVVTELNFKRALSNVVTLPIGVTLKSTKFYINLVKIDESERIIHADKGWTTKERTVNSSGSYYIILANDPTTEKVNIYDIDVMISNIENNITEKIETLNDELTKKIETLGSEIDKEIGKDISSFTSFSIGGINTVVGNPVVIRAVNDRAHSDKMYLKKGVVFSSENCYINRISVDENDIILSFDSRWTTQTRKIESDGYYRLLLRNLGNTAITASDMNINKFEDPTNLAQRVSQIESNVFGSTHYEFVKKIEREKNYESWAKCMYDYEKGISLIVYSSGVDHPYANKDIKICIEKDGLYTVKTVASGDSSVSLKPMCIYKKNGVYTIFGTHGINNVDNITKVYKYTSTDLETWNAEEVEFPFQSIGGYITIDNVSNVNGRLFTNLSYYSNDRAFVCYSDDDGLTWTTVELTYNGTTPCEMIYFGIQDKIVMLARKGIPNQTDAQPLYISISNDNGETWSELEDTNGITDSNASNLSAIRFGDNSMLIVYGSRHGGTAGIYCSVTKFEDILKNNFAEPIKLLSGLSNSNFGYPFVYRRGMDIYFTYYSAENASDNTTASVILCKLICPNDNIINAFNDIVKLI